MVWSHAYAGPVRFELVRERVAALPRELPAPPAILTPVRLDSSEGFVPSPDRRGRPAAVLVLLYPDDEAQARVLLTVRVPHLSTHAGEVSFPGGSAERLDADPTETALREAAEEVGLDTAACGARVVGQLETFGLTVSGFRIVPVVALAERAPECHPNPDEVARVVHAPVEAFLPDAPVELEERVIRERLIRYGVYPVEGERVWGATARMLGQLGATLAAEMAETPETTPETTFAPDLAPKPAIRTATEADGAAIDAFLRAMAPELVHRLPPASELLIAEIGAATPAATPHATPAGRVAGLACWAPWDRPRSPDDPRGFDGLEFPGEVAAELTLLAVAPDLRGRGIGAGLTLAAGRAAAAAGSTVLLAWTLADAAIDPSAVRARSFFRGHGFSDVAVDRRIKARGEDRLLVSRPIDASGPDRLPKSRA